MARYRRKRHYSRKGMTIPLAPIAGLAVGIVPSIQSAIAGDYMGAADGLAWRYTGYNLSTGTFDMNGLKQGMLPLIVGGLVHKFVGGAPLNLNRTLANAGVPYVRI